MRVMIFGLLGMTHRFPVQAGIIFTILAVPAFDEGGIDVLRPTAFTDDRHYLFLLTYDDAGGHTFQFALTVPLFVHLCVFESPVDDPYRTGTPPYATIRSGFVVAVGIIKGLLIEPGVGQEQGGRPVAIFLEFAQKDPRLFERSFRVMDGMNEATVRQNGDERPSIPLIITKFGLQSSDPLLLRRKVFLFLRMKDQNSSICTCSSPISCCI